MAESNDPPSPIPSAITLDNLPSETNSACSIIPLLQSLSASPTTSTIKNQNENKSYRIDYSKSIEERLCFFFEKNLGTDVKFIVGEENEQKEISAHKMMLGSASPVFFSMFFGGIGSEDVVMVPDCDPDSFQSAIEYLYKGKLPSLTIYDKPSEMLYIARKYNIEPLEQECVRQLEAHIHAPTVIEINRLANIFDLHGLQNTCWGYIIRNVEDVLDSSWKPIERSLLLSILRHDQLNISELSLFQRVLAWGKNECTKIGLEPTIENIRSRLGEALSLIRFPIMSPEDIAVHVAPTGLLTLPQLANIFIAIHSPVLGVSEFSQKPRQALPKNDKSKNIGFFFKNDHSSSSSDNNTPGQQSQSVFFVPINTHNTTNNRRALRRANRRARNQQQAELLLNH